MKKLLAPKNLDALLAILVPIFAISGLALVAIALYWGLFVAPADYQQQDAFRIIYVHVPAAFLSLGIYTGMAIAAGMALIFRIKAFDYWATASAPVGAAFTFLALVTGAIWGKPMWGTWWVWDARLTSELILLFVYLGIILLRDALQQAQQPATAAQILTVVGLVNIPIVHFSVNWWYTLHQGATLSKFAKPEMHPSMLWPLLISIVGFALIYLFLTCLKTRTLLWRGHAESRWLAEKLEAKHG
jgi:heme exporter protein C